MDTFFMELGDYYATPTASENADGTWEASVAFERRSDHAQLKTLVPGMRHVIRQPFKDRDAAMSAASDLAVQLVEKGEVGL